MVALNEQPQHRHRAKAPSIHAAPYPCAAISGVYPNGHTAAAAIGRFNSANRRGGHKSVESVKSADHSLPHVPMSKIPRLRSRLCRCGEDQSAESNGNVVQAFHYDGFGNALGFTPSSAITQYLYTQQYYDQFSSTYYDWARNYNPSTGEFTQADYGNYGAFNDPMSMLPYTFAGGDPINNLDLNGHDFSLADTISVESISNLIDTGLGYVNTAFKVYNTAQDILRVIQYAQFAVQLVQALAGAPTLTAAEDAVGAAITNAFPDFEANSLSAGFSAAYNVLAKDWEQISKAIAAKIPEIADKSAMYATGNLAGWATAYEEGRLKFMIFAPSAPGPLGKVVPLNLGKELQLALSAGGGRLFGFGIRTSQQSYNQIFRIDYWDFGHVDVHYQIGSGDTHYPIWPV